MPFPSCFKGEIFVLAYSQFGRNNFMLLQGELGGVWSWKDRKLLKLSNVCGSNPCGGKTVVPVGQKK